MGRKRALITGITGQDGSYLSELLLAKDYDVAGVVQPAEFDAPDVAFSRIADVRGQLRLIPASLSSSAELERLIREVDPDECYHLAAKSFVSYDPADEAATLEINIGGSHALLASLRAVAPRCRTFVAASSEVFGNAAESPQTEKTRLQPRSFYGMTKIACLHLVRLYRELHGVHVSAGILYNHESPRRPPDFVTRKITAAVARIASGEEMTLQLGDLDSRRDWGHARDYVRGMWLMLQQSTPDDYILATGQTRSVRDFCEIAFSTAGLRYVDHVSTSADLLRPAERAALAGDASRARRVLGWQPEIGFEELVREMVEHDLRALGVRVSSTQR